MAQRGASGGTRAVLDEVRLPWWGTSSHCTGVRAPALARDRSCAASMSPASKACTPDAERSNSTQLPALAWASARAERSEEHTSELQSPDHLVCRLLLEKKKQVKDETGAQSRHDFRHVPSIEPAH